MSKKREIERTWGQSCRRSVVGPCTYGWSTYITQTSSGGFERHRPKCTVAVAKRRSIVIPAGFYHGFQTVSSVSVSGSDCEAQSVIYDSGSLSLSERILQHPFQQDETSEWKQRPFLYCIYSLRLFNFPLHPFSCKHNLVCNEAQDKSLFALIEAWVAESLGCWYSAIRRHGNSFK